MAISLYNAKKETPLSQLRDKGVITSAVPLSFRQLTALELAISGKPGAAYLIRCAAQRGYKEASTCCLAPTGSSLVALSSFACPYRCVIY